MEEHGDGHSCKLYQNLFIPSSSSVLLCGSSFWVAVAARRKSWVAWRSASLEGIPVRWSCNLKKITWWPMIAAMVFGLQGGEFNLWCGGSSLKAEASSAFKGVPAPSGCVPDDKENSRRWSTSRSGEGQEGQGPDCFSSLFARSFVLSKRFQAML